MTENLLAVPSEFRRTALAFPDKVEEVLAHIETPEDATALLDKAEIMSQFARRIRADTESVNAIQYGKLAIIAKLAEWLPRGKGGRGKKSDTRRLGFGDTTIKFYRKIGDNRPRLKEYREKVEANNAALPEDHPDIIEASAAHFLRYVGSGTEGNIKAQQNRGVIEWYTPAEYVAAARKTMGGIDLDPASSDEANEIVKAKTYHTQEDDGLEYAWAGRVFMNPPFKASLISRFVAKLCEHVRSGEVTQAILLTNNNTDTKWWHDAAELAAAVCFTRGRVAFYAPGGIEASPTNGHTFFYFGPRVEAFLKHFGRIGTIMETTQTVLMEDD